MQGLWHVASVFVRNPFLRRYLLRSCYFLILEPPVAMLSFQPDPPTLKHLHCIPEEKHVLDMRVENLKMVLRMVYALYWASVCDYVGLFARATFPSKASVGQP